MISDTTYPAATNFSEYLLNFSFVFHPIQNNNRIQIFKKLQVQLHSLIRHKIYHQLPSIEGSIYSYFLSTILYVFKWRCWEVPMFNQICTMWQRISGKVRSKFININIQCNLFILILLQYLTKNYHRNILL